MAVLQRPRQSSDGDIRLHCPVARGEILPINALSLVCGRPPMRRLSSRYTFALLLLGAANFGGVAAAAFSRDGKFVVTGSGLRERPGDPSRHESTGGDWLVRIWDATKGTELARFAGHVGGITDLKISPDGRYALSCGVDSSVRLWALPPDPAMKKKPGK